MFSPNKPFRVLSDDEFSRLPAEEKRAYLREAVDALEHLKSQLRRAIMLPMPSDSSAPGETDGSAK